MYSSRNQKTKSKTPRTSTHASVSGMDASSIGGALSSAGAATGAVS